MRIFAAAKTALVKILKNFGNILSVKNLMLIAVISRNSHRRCSIRKGVLRTFEELVEEFLTHFAWL